MTTTKSSCSFSRANTPPAVKLPITQPLRGLRRLRAAIAVLPPKKKRGDAGELMIAGCVGLSLGQRQTLMTLAGRLPPEEDGIFDGRQPIRCTLNDIAAITCYGVKTTAYHLRALSKAGWLYADLGWENAIGAEGEAGEEATFYLSVGIELYADILRIVAQEAEASSSEKETLAEQRAQLTQTLSKELQINRQRTAAQAKARRRVVRSADPLANLKETIVDMAMAIAARANAGLVVAYQMRDLMNLCRPYAKGGKLAGGDGLGEKAEQVESKEGQGVELPCENKAAATLGLPAGPACETASSACANATAPVPFGYGHDEGQKPTSTAKLDACELATPNRQAEKKVSSNADDPKKATQLRNHLFVQIHHLDAKLLTPEFLAEIKQANISQLEAKIASVSRIARTGSHRGAGA